MKMNNLEGEILDPKSMLNQRMRDVDPIVIANRENDKEREEYSGTRIPSNFGDLDEKAFEEYLDYWLE